MAALTREIPFSDLPDYALARPSQFLGSVIPAKRSTWYRWVQEGIAPAPVHLVPGGPAAWQVGALKQWLLARAAKAS